MPSSNIDSCAGVSETRPVSVTGHWKWPLSSRLLNRQRPWPSNQSSLISPPRLPRKANKAPLNGLFLQHLLGQHRQSVHPFAHVGGAACQPDTRPRWQNNHPRSAASTRRKARASTRASTRTDGPSGRAISINPDGRRPGRRPDRPGGAARPPAQRVQMSRLRLSG